MRINIDVSYVILILLIASCIGEPDILDGLIKRVNQVECLETQPIME